VDPGKAADSASGTGLVFNFVDDFRAFLCKKIDFAFGDLGDCKGCCGKAVVGDAGSYAAAKLPPFTSRSTSGLGSGEEPGLCSEAFVALEALSEPRLDRLRVRCGDFGILRKALRGVRSA